MKLGRRVSVILAALHLAFIVAVASRSATRALLNGETYIPAACTRAIDVGESLAGGVLATNASPRSWRRAPLDLYLNATGIDAGYGFFAPNVSENGKLMCQLRFADGATKIVPPIVGNASSGLRLMDLLDRTLQVTDLRLREYIVRKMAVGVWREYPDATEIRAVFGTVIPPSI
ncbi:MAG: hypothetical protein ACJ8JD_03000, partial [Chthoniobacterales bacterium]